MTLATGWLRRTLADVQADDTMAELLQFDEGVFVLLFLPIIIFESSYALRKRYFFHQVGTILLLAVVGTLISTLVVGFGLYALARLNTLPAMSWAECLAFGSIISAVDPVATLSVFRSLQVTPRPTGPKGLSSALRFKGGGSGSFALGALWQHPSQRT